MIKIKFIHDQIEEILQNMNMPLTYNIHITFPNNVLETNPPHSVGIATSPQHSLDSFEESGSTNTL